MRFCYFYPSCELSPLEIPWKILTMFLDKQLKNSQFRRLISEISITMKAVYLLFCWFFLTY